MKRLKQVWRILKVLKADKIIIAFIIFVFMCAYLLKSIEPEMNTLRDSLWYCFAVISSCGFGDYSAQTGLGRLFSVMLWAFSILIVSFIPSVLVSYYLEFVKLKKEESVSLFLEKLENLPNLSKNELEVISDKIKKIRYKQPKN